MKKVLLIAIAFAAIASSCKGPVRLVRGPVDPIKGQELMEVRFTYENMQVNRLPEADYIRQRQERAARGDEGAEGWLERWTNYKTELYEPQFIDRFNRFTEHHGILLDKDFDDSEFIMIVNTYFIDTGMFAGVRNKEAVIKATATFVRRDAPNNPIVVFDITKAHGAMPAPDKGIRIQMAFAQAGRLLSSQLTRELK